MSATYTHTPVLVGPTLDLLAPALSGPGVVVDATVGLGGHAQALLERFPDIFLIGLDRDERALEHTRARLAPFGDRFTAVHCRYDQIGAVLAAAGHAHVQAVLADLGVSSMQLDDAARGFSYMSDAPLDMRMDTSQGHSASELLATLTEPELARLIRRYGDDPHARRIAAAIASQTAPLTTTGQLAQVIARAVPRAARGGHPAKRTFQALRIAVNEELASLQAFLPAAIEALAVGGRIALMSYHSGEDRLVKAALARGANSSAPVDWPVEPPEYAPYLRLLTRGALQADAAERAANPRSASVRVRAGERLRPTPDHVRKDLL